MSRMFVLGLVVLACFLAVAAMAGMQDSPGPVLQAQSVAADTAPGSGTDTVPVYDSFSDEEIADLTQMQDWEKYVRDMYVTFAATYRTLPIYDSMAGSADLLLNSGNQLLPEPVSTDSGVFTDSAIAEDYSRLVGATGSDVTDSLTTAAAAEEKHIANLAAAMSRTHNTDLLSFYNSELSVAENNLRTFARMLTDLGMPYMPQYIDMNSFTAITSGPADPVTLPSASQASFSAVSLGLVAPGPVPVAAAFASLPAGTLTDTEQQDVLFLQEEMKFIRDLDTTLYSENTDLPLLAAMAHSADTEMTSDNVILERYGLIYIPPDTGVFNNNQLRILYNDLLSNTTVLPTDLLSTAARAEDLHLADLSGAYQRTDNADLQYIYGQQLAISRNNLREIDRELRAQGSSFSPQYISMASYLAIISGPVEDVAL